MPTQPVSGLGLLSARGELITDTECTVHTVDIPRLTPRSGQGKLMTDTACAEQTVHIPQLASSSVRGGWFADMACLRAISYPCPR